jgi:DNA-binding NtrC family response regulator
VFERLTRDNPVLPIIIITARSDQRAAAEAAGVGALMEKPLNIPRLLRLIVQLIAERPAERIARLTGHAPYAVYSQSREDRSKP